MSVGVADSVADETQGSKFPEETVSVFFFVFFFFCDLMGDPEKMERDPGAPATVRALARLIATVLWELSAGESRGKQG